MRFALMVFMVGVLSVSATAQEAKQSRRQPPVLEAINARMQAFVDAGDISGAVTLVSSQGKIVHLGAVGYANLDQKTSMQTSSLFAIASMTKPIVATGLMILQDEGKLSVDDEVARYLPAFRDLKLKDGSAAERAITIRDCLTHTAGFTGRQAYTEGTLAGVVESLATRPLAFQPGTDWQYSPGMNVVGRIIEVVSEQPLEVFLKQRIFDPLKMNQTTFFPSKRQIRRMAMLYEKKKGHLDPAVGFLGDLSSIQLPNPSGGLISSARDVQRFFQMILRKGRFRNQPIVSAAAVRAMTSLQTGNLETGFTPGNGWGLGWCLVQEPQGVSGMLSKGSFGHGGAFGTQVWVDPKTKAVFVLMIQREGLPNSDDSRMRLQFQTAAVSAIAKRQE